MPNYAHPLAWGQLVGNERQRSNKNSFFFSCEHRPLFLISMQNPMDTHIFALIFLSLLTSPAVAQNNGGMFRYGTVSWIRTQQNPPIISFTVEAAFRRSYGSVDFRGSGPDGNLVYNDKFRPSGYETIAFDFGDSRMLTPMLFQVTAYSISEDWVQAVSTFDHQYPEITAATWWKPLEQGAFLQTVFRGCCRVSNLLGGNADTSWSLVSVVNLLLDYSSPRLSSLPIITVRKRQRPLDPDPSFYILADDNYPTTNEPSIQPAMPTAWGFTADIGGAGAALDQTTRPRNLPNFMFNSTTGLITLAAGPAFNSTGLRCTNWTAVGCRANATLPGLPPGLYNVVIEVSRAPAATAGSAASAPTMLNTSAPIEVMVSLVDESLTGPLPVTTSLEPGILYPAFSQAQHVAFVGFPMQPFTLIGNTSAQGVNLGFTVSRLPDNMEMTTVRGGVAVFTGAKCINGSSYCAQTPAVRCNASKTGCTCQPPNNGVACNASAPSAPQCVLGGTCAQCWERQDCAASPGLMTASWTPVTGQEWTHMACFSAIAERPAAYCPDPTVPACGPASSPPQCINIDVLPNPPPAIWSSYAADVDPYAGTGQAYLGRPLIFTVYSNDSDCAQVPGSPAISMGPMPPGAALAPQQVAPPPPLTPPPLTPPPSPHLGWGLAVSAGGASRRALSPVSSPGQQKGGDVRGSSRDHGAGTAGRCAGRARRWWRSRCSRTWGPTRRRRATAACSSACSGGTSHSPTAATAGSTASTPPTRAAPTPAARGGRRCRCAWSWRWPSAGTRCSWSRRWWRSPPSSAPTGYRRVAGVSVRVWRGGGGGRAALFGPDCAQAPRAPPPDVDGGGDCGEGGAAAHVEGGRGLCAGEGKGGIGE